MTVRLLCARGPEPRSHLLFGVASTGSRLDRCPPHDWQWIEAHRNEDLPEWGPRAREIAQVGALSGDQRVSAVWQQRLRRRPQVVGFGSVLIQSLLAWSRICLQCC